MTASKPYRQPPHLIMGSVFILPLSTLEYGLIRIKADSPAYTRRLGGERIAEALAAYFKKG